MATNIIQGLTGNLLMLGWLARIVSRIHNSIRSQSRCIDQACRAPHVPILRRLCPHLTGGRFAPKSTRGSERRARRK
jgi:hypothetical protein